MPELTMRPYQRAALDALENAWSGLRRPSRPDGAPVNRPAVVLPTGAGKTVIFSRLGAKAHAAGGRALFLVHRDELADQTARKLHDAAPSAHVGVIKAERNDTQADLVVASVQTLQNARRRDQLAPEAFMLGVADECHHAASPSWMTVMAHFGAFRQGDDPRRTPWAGFTATMSREDKRGLGDVWEEIVYTRSIGEMVRDGYLVPPVGKRIQVEDLDLARVKASRGDLAVGDLSDALLDAEAPRQAAAALLEHAKDRRTAAFWPSVDTAEVFAMECRELGIAAEVVVGTTPRAERQAIYERFRTGETAVISTAMVLTEGWDAPWCDCILIGRPTHSRGLFIQMVGRGLRLWPGKRDCLVLDLRGASSRHGLASLTDLSLSPEEDEKRETEPVDEDDLVGDPDDLADDVELWTPDGPLRATDVDLFADSPTVWLQTSDRGWWFVPAGAGCYFLYPQATGQYAVGSVSFGPVRNLQRHEKDLSLEYAMAWAERYAAETDEETAALLGFSLSSKRAAWRRGKAKSTPAQQHKALVDAGIPREISTRMTKRELADAINIALATRALRKVA